MWETSRCWCNCRGHSPTDGVRRHLEKAGQGTSSKLLSAGHQGASRGSEHSCVKPTVNLGRRARLLHSSNLNHS